MNAEQRDNELSNLEAKKSEIEITMKHREKDPGAKAQMSRWQLELDQIKKRIKELTPPSK